MESFGGSSGTSMTAAAAMPSPSVVADASKVFCSSLFKATNYEFDPSISEDERRFYLKAYPTVDIVRERKTHCTVCKVHIGTAPVQETGIKMHPILRVTHCNKCHDFYNSGEFSKGEDGSELYCRWCGQGGEVYCCSSCPYVFCKSCIVKNLSRGVVADIEQNENWSCFSCAPKILWPLRAQHWALMNYIEQQKKEIYSLHLSEAEIKLNLGKDRSRCCRLAKSKCGNMSDSMESLDSVASKRSHGSSSNKKPMKHSATPPQQANAAKRAKNNDEVVCTPDLLSMLEPDCQITVTPKTNRPMPTPSASTPKIMSIQQPQVGYGSMSSTPKTSAPPPLVLRNTAIKIRQAVPPPVVRRTIIGPRTPAPGGGGTPVYHTINGYRIDLNSAAQQETFRLPNGKLIQVKRQGPPPQNPSPSSNNWQQMTSTQPQRVIPQTIASRPVQITQHPYNISVQQQQPGQHPQVVRYHNNMIGSTTINALPHNGTTIQVLNGQMSSAPPPQQQQQQQQPHGLGPMRPVMIRHVFPDNPIGHARTGLQDQVFNAMEICTHLTNKVQTLTNSNAYKQARNFLEVKELYIHLSYLLTYAIGRFKSLQDKCLGDMRTLGFGNDADCLENGQLAADKQASDDEDNEIEIVEPKTDLITLDSDDDEPTGSSTPLKPQQPTAQTKAPQSSFSRGVREGVDVKVKPGSVTITQVPKPNAIKTLAPPTIADEEEDNMDLMSMAQSFLASMLEVDIHEGPPGADGSAQKKQPRKKLTNKPNPTLLKQKALMERERLEEMKRNDQKLKMQCSVELKKAEEEFPCAKLMLEAKAKEKLEMEQSQHIEEQKLNEKLSDETDNVIVEVSEINSSTEENKETNTEDPEKNKANKILNKADEKETTEKIKEATKENIADKESSLSISEKEDEIRNKSKENEQQINESKDESGKEMKSDKDILDDRKENLEKSYKDTEDDKEENKDDKEENKEDKEDEKLKKEDKIDEKIEEILPDDETENKETSYNAKTDDIEETKANGSEDANNLPEDMETDEKPPATPTQDESMEVDDIESPEENSESNNSKQDENKQKEKEVEDLSMPQQKQMEDVTTPPTQDLETTNDKENENKETNETATENDKSSSLESNKDVVKDNESITAEEINKTLPSAVEDLPSKEQTTEEPTSEAVAATLTDNRNV